MNLGGQVTQTLERALDVNWFRQQLIANNIANVDTPRYQRQDLNFQQSMVKALAVQGPEATVSKPSDWVVAADPVGTASRTDGNNVDIENEMAQQAITLLQYNILTRLESDQLGMLRTAISGGGS